MTRRRALMLATLAVGSTGLALVGRDALTRTGPALARRLRPSDTLDAAAPTGALSPHERATLLALATHVLPGTPTHRDAFASAYIESQARSTPGALAAYRMAVALLDTGAQVPFVDRPPDAQRAALEHLLPSYAGRDRLGRWRSRVFQAEASRRFHVLVVRDLTAAFFRTPEGWRLAGHPRGYGEPASHPLAYTHVSALGA